MQLSEEQILALAPDESSKKSGKELANPNKWVSKGANEQAMWGECQGSGSKPYQTQVDLRDIAFKCSCPSRKFPCKHGLGLMLFHARQSQDFTVSEAPGWVSEWLGKRADKEEKKTEKKDKPVDEAAQAKRAQQREQKVSDGAGELLLWIKDIVRNGILNMPEKNPVYWENMAKRMIDAQASGLAGMVNELGSINFYKEGWQSGFMDVLVRMYMLISAYKNIDQLNAELQQDIKTLIGFNQNQEEIKALDGVTDKWFVMGKQTTQEQQLTVERNWLYGISTGKYALVLQFYVRSQLPTVIITPGMTLQAELVFYPSATPLRALIKQQTGVETTGTIAGCKNWTEVAEKEAGYNMMNPFINSYPYVIERLLPVKHNNEWWLQDEEKNLARIGEGFTNIWRLLSVSGGKPLPIAVAGKENSYTPIGVWNGSNYILL